MAEPWVNFAVVVLVQTLLFMIHAYLEKEVADIPRILERGVLSGLILGLLLDVVLGKFLGIWSYSLGFGALFLILNAVLSYGLFAANALLMQRTRILHFIVWTLIVTAAFEITNRFFPTWTWKFASLPLIGFLTVICIGNLGAAMLVRRSGSIFAKGTS